MATRNTSASKREKITEAFIDYFLTEGKHPQSVYAFTKAQKMKEGEFYEHFTSFQAIEQQIWVDSLNNTLTGVQNSEEYSQYSTREKMLAFFYTWFEALKQQRSFYVASFEKVSKIKSDKSILDPLKTQLLDYLQELVNSGLEQKEIEDRKQLTNKYKDAIWLQTLFLLGFWSKDNSANFEKTDAAIEKSVNLAFDLMGKSTLDSMLDFGKFLFQNKSFTV